MNQLRTPHYSALLFFGLAVLVRFLPHPPNFACVGALGLFVGCHLRGWNAWLLPLGAMAVSDWIGQLFEIPGMGFYSPLGMLFVYGAFLIGSLMGMTLRGRTTPVPVLSVALLSSIMFFFVSNFGAWLSSIEMYDRTWDGLVACYVSAIPFFRNTLLGDLFFTSLFFGSYQLYLSSVKSAESVRQ